MVRLVLHALLVALPPQEPPTTETRPSGAASRATSPTAAELERRIAHDFRLRRADVERALAASLKDFRPAELDGWLAEGLFDVRTLGGELRFHTSARSNLFFRKPALAARRSLPDPDGLGAVLERAVDEATAHPGERAVEATFTLRVKADAARPGAVVRAWLPIPRAAHRLQTAGEIVAADPKPVAVNPPLASARAAAFERIAVAGEPTIFKVTTRYVTRSGGPEAPRAAGAEPLSAEERAQWTAERPPHVVFSPVLKELAERAAGDARTPSEVARRIYDWVGDNIVYSYALEYSTIPSISEDCAARRRGDCGQAALLFITLCRLRGVPARWQSGWAVWPGEETIHDWAEIWIDDRGWTPVDPFVSVFAATQSPKRRAKLRDFYFGGYDRHRYVANGDHGVALDPPHASWRSDDVDFQRGEVEADGKNIYFDGFGYELTTRSVDG